LIEKFKEDPQKFWKLMGSIRKTYTKVEIEPDILLNHYETLFNEKEQTEVSKLLELSVGDLDPVEFATGIFLWVAIQFKKPVATGPGSRS
jgi:hypothetical protein